MTIAERISTLVRANINDLIDQAEDPETVINQLLLDMHSLLLQARMQVAAAIADEKLLYARYQENQARATNWHQQYEEQSKQVTALEEALAQLEAKIAEVETTKNLLIPRSRRARAKTEIRTPFVVLDDRGALHDFERLKQTVDEMEARAAALREMKPDSVDERFAGLATGQQVERELAALKANKAHAAPAEPVVTAG